MIYFSIFNFHDYIVAIDAYYLDRRVFINQLVHRFGFYGDPVNAGLPIGARRESVNPSSPGTIPKSRLDTSLESMSVFKATRLKDLERNNQMKEAANTSDDTANVTLPIGVLTE